MGLCEMAVVERIDRHLSPRSIIPK
jgi:hypothetical protein